MDKDKKAERINTSFTQPLEAKWLPRFANALPGWVNSDHLTYLGLAAAFIIGIGYLLTFYSKWWLLLSNLGLILHWYGDSLDGTLARVRKMERERYGYFVDHLSDIWSILVISVGLGASPLVQMEIALFVAMGYSLMNVYVHVVAYTRQKFLLSHGKIGPTEFRVILFVINIMVIFWNPVVYTWEEEALTVLDIAGIGIGVILVFTFIQRSISGAKILNEMDTAARKEHKKEEAELSDKPV